MQPSFREPWSTCLSLDDVEQEVSESTHREQQKYSKEEYDRIRASVTQEVQKEMKDSLDQEIAAKKAEKMKLRSKTKRKLQREQGKFVPSTKNRIRSIERTLARKGHLISKEKQDEMRRQIETLKREFDEVKLVERERLFATKYRKIKFFERRKLERMLTKNKRAAKH